MKPLVQDKVSPGLLAGHAKVAAGLRDIRDAVGCPICYAQELMGLIEALEDLIADAEEAAAEDAEDAERAGALH